MLAQQEEAGGAVSAVDPDFVADLLRQLVSHGLFPSSVLYCLGTEPGRLGAKKLMDVYCEPSTST